MQVVPVFKLYDPSLPLLLLFIHPFYVTVPCEKHEGQDDTELYHLEELPKLWIKFSRLPPILRFLGDEMLVTC